MGAYYRFIGYASVALGVLVLLGGGVMWDEAAERKRRFIPVDATMTASRYFHGAEARNGKCGRLFLWQYVFEDSTYEAEYPYERVWTLSNCDSLKLLVAEHPIGRQLPGFHDTQRPDRSFLYPRRDERIAIFVPFAGMLILIGIAMLREYRGYGSAPVLRRYGVWYHLRPMSSLSGRAQLWGVAALWMAVSYAPAVYWQNKLALAPVFNRSDAVVGLLGTLAFAIGWIISGARARAYEDPVVAVDRSPLRCGEVFRLRFIQMFRAPVHVRSVRMGLQCRYLIISKQSREVTVARASEQREIDRTFSAGERLEMEMDLRVPDDADIFESVSRGLYWMVTVRCDGVGIADADVQYAVPVETRA